MQPYTAFLFHIMSEVPCFESGQMAARGTAGMFAQAGGHEGT
jgi:hypothetical protein